MDTCETCNREYSFMEAWKGYWLGWKINCPECNSRYRVPYSDRWKVMIFTLMIPFILAHILSGVIFEDPLASLRGIVIISILLILFSFGTPFLVKFSEKC